MFVSISRGGGEGGGSEAEGEFASGARGEELIMCLL